MTAISELINLTDLHCSGCGDIEFSDLTCTGTLTCQDCKNITLLNCTVHALSIINNENLQISGNLTNIARFNVVDTIINFDETVFQGGNKLRFFGITKRNKNHLTYTGHLTIENLGEGITKFANLAYIKKEGNPFLLTVPINNEKRDDNLFYLIPETNGAPRSLSELFPR